MAISNHRLVSLADGKVTFLWRDRAHGSRQLSMTLTANEFLRRFLLHLLPKQFVRIRNFGFLTNRKRAMLLPVCLRLLGCVREASYDQEQAAPDCVESLGTCPQCGGPMIMIRLITPADVLLRSPPAFMSVDCHPDAQVRHLPVFRAGSVVVCPRLDGNAKREDLRR